MHGKTPSKQSSVSARASLRLRRACCRAPAPIVRRAARTWAIVRLQFLLGVHRCCRGSASTMKHKVKRIHFVGIGGSGMSGIAEVLLNLGYQVSGSDLAENAATERLRSLGAHVFRGHDATHVQGADAVVVSTAVQARQPGSGRGARHAHSRWCRAR